MFTPRSAAATSSNVDAGALRRLPLAYKRLPDRTPQGRYGARNVARKSRGETP